MSRVASHVTYFILHPLRVWQMPYAFLEAHRQDLLRLVTPAELPALLGCEAAEGQAG